MVKPEWGTKRTCPNCGTRFYDLQKDNPVVCIDCAHEWVPEPILKSKQPIVAMEEEKKPEAESEEEIDINEDVNLDEDEDDVLSDTSLDDDENEEVAAMVDTSLTDDE